MYGSSTQRPYLLSLFWRYLYFKSLNITIVLRSEKNKLIMTNSPQGPSNPKNKPQEEYDIVLMVVLTFFNLGSGATTILGAMQILPIKYLAWTLGGAVQLMLFLLQAGLVVKANSPSLRLRKWLAIMVLASASVYTSFFTYYGQLAQETNEKRAIDRAVTAHNRLISEVYTPMKDHLRDLQQEAVTLRVTAKAEQEKGIETGIKGYGSQARKLDKLALDKEIEAKNFENTVNELRPLFQYNLENLEPKDILKKDGEALSSAPKDFRENYPELKRGDYIDEDLEFSLLAPYLKVKNQDEAALLALLIAIGVDGMAIMLGTAIVAKRLPAKDENLQNAVEYVTLDLKEKGSNFLKDFYDAISPVEPHTINYSALRQKYGNYDSREYPGRQFLDELKETRTALDKLLDKLGGTKTAWVVRNNEDTEWVVPPKHYHQLVNWLQKEIKRQKSLEAQKEEEIGYGYGFSELEETPVQFQIPKKPVNPNSN